MGLGASPRVTRRARSRRIVSASSMTAPEPVLSLDPLGKLRAGVLGNRGAAWPALPFDPFDKSRAGVLPLDGLRNGNCTVEGWRAFVWFDLLLTAVEERPMAPELKLRLFGPPQISLGARALSFTRRPAIALLAYLAITGRMVARETLAALLASDTTESLARQHLRNALSDLNSQLGDYLVVTRQTIAFDRTRPYWLDV